MFSSLMPHSFRNQILWLLFSSLVIAQAISFFLIVGERSFVSSTQRIDNSIEQFVTFASLVDTTPDYLHYDLLQSVNNEKSFFRLNDKKQLLVADTNTATNRINQEAQQRFIRYLSLRDDGVGNPVIIITDSNNESSSGVKNNYAQFIKNQTVRQKQTLTTKILGSTPASDRMDIEVQLPSGLWLYASFETEKLSIGLQSRLIGIVALTIITVGITGFLITLKITVPISSLASASEQLGKGQTVSLLEEKGPNDIREALIAFNKMNERLTQLLSSQKQMLGAISHDLRSPLTSLRLRLESVNDSVEKDKMVGTVEEMNEMIAAILNFTREEAEEKSLETSRPVNLNVFCKSLITEYTDTGRICTLDFFSNPNCELTCRYISLRRALRNIIDNGLRHGDQVALSVQQTDDQNILLIVSDNGPGIAEEYLQDVLKPFFRPDKARRASDGGIGMGLSISESIIKAHGGSLILSNGKHGGLQASIKLPL